MDGAIRTETEIVVVPSRVKTLGRPKSWLRREAECTARNYFEQWYWASDRLGEATEPDDCDWEELALDKFSGPHGEDRAAALAISVLRDTFRNELEHNGFPVRRAGQAFRVTEY